VTAKASSDPWPSGWKPGKRITQREKEVIQAAILWEAGTRCDPCPKCGDDGGCALCDSVEDATFDTLMHAVRRLLGVTDERSQRSQRDWRTM